MPGSVPAIVFVLVSAMTGDAGSLAAAQFNESLRRLFVPRVTWRVTDVDIPPPFPIAAPPPGPPSPVEPPAAVADDIPASAPADSWPAVSDEAGWRARTDAARAALETDQLLADAMQSRINALTRDVSARDDPAQRAELERQRIRALAEQDRLIKQVQADKDAIAALAEAARKRDVPPGWIR